MFIGEFDILLMSLFNNRGQVTEIDSPDDAFDQKGAFTLIVVDNEFASGEFLASLASSYPTSPIVVSADGEERKHGCIARYVRFEEVATSQIPFEEKLARSGISVRMIREVHRAAKRLLILVHNQPDPDAIASAMALRTLLGRNKKTATIGYLGERISRPENVAMVELMDVDLQVISHKDIKNFDSVALVDVQPSYFGGEITNIDSVIDHHPITPECDAKFTEISSEEGATATIMTRLLRAAQVEISKKLSTALVYGIKTDTMILNRGANLDDLEAFTYLYNQADLGLLRKIESKNLYSEEVKHYGRALSNHWINDGIIFMNLGRIEKEHIIPQVADMGMKVEGVEWSVAFGIVSGSDVVISVRNSGSVKSAGRLLFELFDEIGSTGGHRSYAKVVIPVQEVRKLIGKTSRKNMEQWIDRVFRTATSRNL